MHFLTEREVLELNDSLMAHSCLIEKYNVFSTMCQDQELKSILDRQRNLLQQHFSVMQSFLKQAQGPVNQQQQNQMKTTTYQSQYPNFQI